MMPPASLVNALSKASINSNVALFQPQRRPGDYLAKGKIRDWPVAQLSVGFSA
jgi:hypothetical protein